MIFLTTVLVVGYIIRVMELPYYRKLTGDSATTFDSYFNSLWLTVITLTTVGYGDISAVTIPGRIVTMALALWGTVLISLMVVIASSIFDLDPNQLMALKHISVQRSAAKSICDSIQYFKAKKHYKMLKMQQEKTRHEP